jgi:hypothetical protein
MRARLPVAVLVALIPLGARAACPAETYLSCPVEDGRVLEVCITGQDFTYSFGPPGAPELALSVSMAAGTVVPWPGVGSAIWSSILFPNNEHVYEVWNSVDRNPDAPNPSGGVNVLKGEDMVAQLTCKPGTVTTPAFALEDAMASQGFCWDFDARRWTDKSCN